MQAAFAPLHLAVSPVREALHGAPSPGWRALPAIKNTGAMAAPAACTAGVFQTGSRVSDLAGGSVGRAPRWSWQGWAGAPAP
jgi:hypothetical protein